MAIIIDGKATSAIIKEEVRVEAEQLKAEKGLTPGLAVIIVGENPASKVYVRNKHQSCIKAGMHSVVIEMPEDIAEETLLEEIAALNVDPTIHGILVQLPLPKHINEDKVLNAIVPEKDVDGFHPTNVGYMTIGTPTVLPCTPAGVIELLERYNIEISGKKCVVIGRSNIVGKPAALLLLAKNGTVTVCHSRTKDLAAVCREADILVVAIGKAKFVTADMVKPGAVVIDVGINRNEEGKLVGDVDFDAVEPIASAITPVPGGVGPMTIAMLMKNTLECAKATLK
ncbi:MAG: bifunctional methylenetetrahydrofolate dehydrogenase/methenyltetrahydrofolate cyclohydrolase FolD [Ruminococcaceae bacterium]|nr:bifunctional methylenetetrahydrofolate dehydrogenase/methenyltetrahydrofolate cyclohydrolase FolD [Oscillospiraceae bacterium]